MNKLTKAKYPEKTSINLVMREEEAGNPKIQLTVFFVFLVFLAVFVKFGVIDQISRANEAESAYYAMQLQIDEYNRQTEDYDEVLKQYSHYSSGYLTEEEKLILDRMDVFQVLDKCVIPFVDVASVNMTGSNVNLTLAETTLQTVSTVVSELQSDEKVAFVTVSTASTNSSSENSSQMVTANMVIQLNTQDTQANSETTGVNAAENAGGDTDDE